MLSEKWGVLHASKLKEMLAIRGWCYNADIPAKEKQLIRVIINGAEYHFFCFQVNDKTYLAVDTTIPFTLTEFRKLSYSILLSFGFLFGDLFLDEGYILSSVSPDFEVIENIQFSTYRESLITGYRVYTTNAYSIYNLTGKTREEIDARITEVQKWVECLAEIKQEQFSNLCELFYKSEPMSRAAINTLQGNIFALELKGSAFSAALEAITSVIMKEQRVPNPKPIDKKAFKPMRDRFLAILDEILPNTEEYKASRTIFTKKINNLNSPTNTDKLSKAFELVDYNLKPYETAALRARNKFQHGELPVIEVIDDAVFRDVYKICLIMHRLIYVLILKRVGFNGYIINYPQLHSHITKSDLGEDLFYKL